MGRVPRQLIALAGGLDRFRGAGRHRERGPTVKPWRVTNLSRTYSRLRYSAR